MSILWRYLRPHRGLVALTLLLAGLAQVLALVDTIAFAGPSGSGKSTLVKLLLGLYAPSSGAVSVDGIPINQLRYNRIRRQIGFVAQDPQLFSGTIRENLQLAHPVSGTTDG